MLKKLLLLSLIILTPVHSLAALQMPYGHKMGITDIKAPEALQHPCHQEVTNISNDDDLLSTQTTACNACTLCMAFGFSPLHFVMMPNHFSMILNASKRISFISYDSLGLKKPPIL